MNRRVLGVILGVASLALAGCTEGEERPPATTVLEGCRLAEEGSGTLRTVAEYVTFWQDHCRGETPPIDMGTHVIVWDTWGHMPTGGYATTLDDLHVEADSITATFKRTQPGENCVVTQASTYPTAVVAIAARPDSVITRHVVETVDC